MQENADDRRITGIIEEDECGSLRDTEDSREINNKNY